MGASVASDEHATDPVLWSDRGIHAASVVVGMTRPQVSFGKSATLITRQAASQAVTPSAIAKSAPITRQYSP